MKLFGLDNVTYEPNSDYKFEELNETAFITQTFEHLVALMGDEFSEYDFYVFSNHLKDALPASAEVSSTKKKILIYISDEYSKDPAPLAGNYFAVFKSYLEERKPAPNVFPFALGCVREVPAYPVTPVQDRKYNVFFRGNINRNRIDLYRNLSKIKFLLPGSGVLGGPGYRKFLLRLKSDFSDRFPDSILIFNKAFKSGFTTHEYGEILASSKIVLCPKGFTRSECFRHYESMRAGCIIVSERLPKIELYEDSPIIQVDNWEEGLSVVRKLLQEPAEMERLQKETIQWWVEKCSERATAAYVFSKIKSLSP